MLARFFCWSPFWFVIALCTLGMFLDLAQAPAQSLRQSKRTSGVGAPDWYNVPPSVPDTLIARGKGKSNDQQVAIDKAIFDARSSLAHSIDHRWEILLRTIQNEGGGTLAWTSEPVTLAGSTLRMQKVFKRGRTWTAYVLVAVPEGSLRTVLLQRLHRDAQWYEGVRNTNAVRELEGTPP
jgi:hypothetical protein